jgi:hypothetical protein
MPLSNDAEITVTGVYNEAGNVMENTRAQERFQGAVTEPPVTFEISSDTKSGSAAKRDG